MSLNDFIALLQRLLGAQGDLLRMLPNRVSPDVLTLRDKLLKEVEDAYQAALETTDPELDRAYEMGVKNAWASAAKFLMIRAGEFFQVGRDTEARLLRDLAKEQQARADN